jgi:FAD/FMN-containing dehydrogenase
MPPHEELLAQLRAITGPAYVLTDRRDMAGYLSEPRDLYHDGQAICVVRPGSREEVSAILALCQSTRTAVVPQGGNTGLVGGQTPLSDGASIVLSLTRMNALRELDLVSNTMTVEAGMTLLQVQEAASQAGRLFPLSLASEGSCTIGGNLATNAGGTAVIAFGTARDLVNGLEVVLADGRVLSNLSKLRKDNTGYDLKHLFMGSEGTLGIITAAVLKLYPKPRAVKTAFIALASPETALGLLGRAKEHFGNAIRAFELLPRIALEIVLRHRSSQCDPFGQAHAWYVLLEVTSQADEGLDELLFSFLEAATEEGLIEDATVATSLDQAKKLWDIRESLPDLSKLEGGSIKHDISVPVASVAAFIAEAGPAVMAAIPGARPVPFGHVGDGNIHYNVSQPIGADKAAFLARWDELNTLVHGIAAKYEGSISAEHGIGQLKRHLLAKVKDPVALDTMRAIKQALDPLGILNPGKVL